MNDTNISSPVLPPHIEGTLHSIARLRVEHHILVTQRREYKLTKLLEQLSLELAMLSERKMAKVIQLLEESRRDNPHVHNRVDQEAEAMAEPADSQSVLEAIHETQIRGAGRRERPTPFKEDVSSLVRSALDPGSTRTD
jgi:hypothetical protein